MKKNSILSFILISMLFPINYSFAMISDYDVESGKVYTQAPKPIESFEEGSRCSSDEEPVEINMEPFEEQFKEEPDIGSEMAPESFDIESRGEITPQEELKQKWWYRWLPWVASERYSQFSEDDDILTKMECFFASKGYPRFLTFMGGLVPPFASSLVKPAVLESKIAGQIADLDKKGILKNLFKASLSYGSIMGLGNALFYYLEPFGLAPALKLTLIAMAQFYLHSGLYEKRLKTEQKKSTYKRYEGEGYDFSKKPKKEKKKKDKQKESAEQLERGLEEV